MVTATTPLGEVLGARTAAGDLCERLPRNEVRCYAYGHRSRVVGDHLAAFNATPQRRSPSFACCLVQDPYLWVGPQVLSYEGPFGVGYLTASVDVLGP